MFFQSAYGAMQTQGLAPGYPGEWQEYQYAEQTGYQEQYLQPGMEGYEVQPETDVLLDPQLMSQEEKDRGLGSVFKRDDQRLQQLRESDAREKDPTFVSESYSECYPGYQEYNHEIVGSDEEPDLSKMDMGGKVCPDLITCSLLFIVEEQNYSIWLLNVHGTGKGWFTSMGL